MPHSDLLTETGAVNGRAVMRLAVANARAWIAEYAAYRLSRGRATTWRDGMRMGLRQAWADVRAAKTVFYIQQEEAAQDARIAAGCEREREIARVQSAIAYVEHADTFRFGAAAELTRLNAELCDLRRAA